MNSWKRMKKLWKNVTNKCKHHNALQNHEASSSTKEEIGNINGSRNLLRYESCCTTHRNRRISSIHRYKTIPSTKKAFANINDQDYVLESGLSCTTGTDEHILTTTAHRIKPSTIKTVNKYTDQSYLIGNESSSSHHQKESTGIFSTISHTTKVPIKSATGQCYILENEVSSAIECQVSYTTMISNTSEADDMLCSERWNLVSKDFLNTYNEYIYNKDVYGNAWENIRELLNCDVSCMGHRSDQVDLLYDVETIYISAMHGDDKIERTVRNCFEIYQNLCGLLQCGLTLPEAINLRNKFLTWVNLLVSKLCKVRVLLQKNKERLDICLGYRNSFLS